MGAVGRHIGDGAGVGLVPGIHFQLQAVALGQEGDILRRQVGHDGVKAVPEVGGRNAGAGQDFGLDELVQNGGNLQAVLGGAGRRGCGHKWKWFVSKKEICAAYFIRYFDRC